MLPTCWLCGSVRERVQKRDNGLCPPFCLRESYSPALALIPDTSMPPCMPQVPFKLLPWCWSSEGVSLNKFLCGFVKGNCLGLHPFLLPTQPLLVFAARSYGDISSWHWNPWLEGLVWGWNSLLPRYPSRSFIYHTWMWDQPVPCLFPSYQSGWMWFL